MKIQLEPLRGFRDLLPPESAKLRQLMLIFSNLVEKYGYQEVIPPTLERFELFALKSGEEIRNTMFTFQDKSGREVALRPEATASIARIYLKHLKPQPKPIRIYYIVNCFRYENPQRARYREFWQAGIELLGGESPYYDVEVIKILLDYIDRVGLSSHVRLKIGSTELYRILFNKFNIPEDVQDHILHLMDKKMYDKALRVIEANASRPEKLKAIISRLWEEPYNLNNALQVVEELDYARKAIEKLIFIDNVLKTYNTRAKYYFDLSFARGLAYYTGIIFEAEVEGFNFSIAGGGRYDNLIELYGGEHLPSTGFAVGLDRVVYVLDELGIEIPVGKPKFKLAVVVLEPSLLGYALKVQDRLLKHPDTETTLFIGQKMSKLIPRLLEQGYTHIVIVGPQEASRNKVSIRDLKARKQVEIELDKLNEVLETQ